MGSKNYSVHLTAIRDRIVDESSLGEFLAAYGDTVSVYNENIETGFVYGYNTDKLYFGASVIKAPYCLYVYQFAEKAKGMLEDNLTYKQEHYRTGTGIIKNMKVGTVFTKEELLRNAIRYSDNIAFRMLINTFGVNNFKEYIRNIGGVTSNIGTVSGANLTAMDAGLYAIEIYKYIESNGRYSKQFKTDLMSTTNPMIWSDYSIARKYGWAKKSFHDMAIVYAESPYILVIMSERDAGTASDYKAFKDISMTIQVFNDDNFR